MSYWIRAELAFYDLQFRALLALGFQLYGFIMSCKMFAIRNNYILASYRSLRQSKLLRKRKHVMARPLRRNAKSVWFQERGRTDCANCTQNARAQSKFSAGLEKNAITWEISAHLPGLKTLARLAQGRLKFQPGLEIPHVIVNVVLERDDWRGGLKTLL